MMKLIDNTMMKLIDNTMMKLIDNTMMKLIDDTVWFLYQFVKKAFFVTIDLCKIKILVHVIIIM